MKLFIQSVAFACLLSGCAAVETPPYAPPAPQPDQSAPAPNEGVNAVLRAPARAEAPMEAPAPPPPVTAQEPQPLPGDQVLFSGNTAVEQVIDPEIDPSSARSYNASWESGGYRHRSLMFPHIIDGCKVMIQSRRTLDYVGGSEGEFYEREGPDCNCDLVIDGFEDVFAQLNDSYKTPRMYDVCAGPGVDGATRQLEIMRESLKEQRNFDKMKNVDGF